MPSAAEHVAVQLEGLKELVRDLQGAEKKEIPKALRKANKRLAEKIVKLALPDVPVRSGRLKASVKALARPTAAMGKAGSPSRVPYAPGIHWGQKTMRRAGKRIPHLVRGRPFLYDAAQKVERDVINEYERDIQYVLDEVRGR